MGTSCLQQPVQPGLSSSALTIPLMVTHMITYSSVPLTMSPSWGWSFRGVAPSLQMCSSMTPLISSLTTVLSGKDWVPCSRVFFPHYNDVRDIAFYAASCTINHRRVKG